MKEKKDCKIVQDLLPNYVEHLTSEETNKYIEEHLATCEECKKIIKNMQKEMKTDGEKIDGREVDYIKKYNKKLKVIKNVQIVVLTLLLVYVATVIWKLIILRDISNKQYNLSNNTNNFHIELRNAYTSGINKTDVYYKDGKTMIKSENFGNREYVTSNGIVYYSNNSIIYQDKDETIFITNYGENKNVGIRDREEGDNLIKKSTKRDFLEDLKYAMYHNIGRDNIDGVDVYILNENGQHRIIDKKTGQPIKNISLPIGDYEYVNTIEYNTVTDKDVEKPDLTGYEIIDNRTK